MKTVPEDCSHNPPNDSPRPQTDRDSGEMHRLPYPEDTAHSLNNILTSAMACLSLTAMDERVPEDIRERSRKLAERCLQGGRLVKKLQDEQQLPRAS